MIARAVLAIAAMLATGSALATPPIMSPPPPAAPPALTVVVSIDGLSSDLFNRYRAHYSGGLARLASGATYNLEGGSAPLLGGADGLAAIVRAGRPGSRTLLVAGSQAAAAILGNAGPGQSWQFAGSRFEQVTAAPPLPIVAQANTAIGEAIAAPQPALQAPPPCAAPPLSTRGGGFARAGGDVAAFRGSPQMDGSVLAFAAALSRDLGLGLTSITADILGLGLSVTGDVVATYGADSQEACLALLSLDRDLGDFLAYLDRSSRDYALVLAGSGPSPAPLLLWRKGWRTEAIAQPARREDIVPTLSAMLGAPRPPADSGGTCLSGLTGVVCPTR